MAKGREGYGIRSAVYNTALESEQTARRKSGKALFGSHDVAKSTTAKIKIQDDIKAKGLDKYKVDRAKEKQKATTTKPKAKTTTTKPTTKTTKTVVKKK